MPSVFVRWKYRWLRYRHQPQELSRRVGIENILFEMAAGKRPLPTEEDCRILALRLGTPKEYWSDVLSNWDNKP